MKRHSKRQRNRFARFQPGMKVKSTSKINKMNYATFLWLQALTADVHKKNAQRKSWKIVRQQHWLLRPL